jgi:hypothetical protein
MSQTVGDAFNLHDMSSTHRQLCHQVAHDLELHKAEQIVQHIKGKVIAQLNSTLSDCIVIRAYELKV